MHNSTPSDPEGEKKQKKNIQIYTFLPLKILVTFLAIDLFACLTNRLAAFHPFIFLTLADIRISQKNVNCEAIIFYHYREIWYQY